MWRLSVSWWELILRGLIVYVFLIVLLRVTGKRQVGQLAPFDLVLLLVLSNAVQNAMTGGDNSVLGGLISASVLVFLNYVARILTYPSKKIESLFQSPPQVPVPHGKVVTHLMEPEKFPHH